MVEVSFLLPGSGRGRGRHAAAEEIRDKLGRFAGRPRFNDEFEEAFEFFFGESVEHLQETLDENDFERFMEWFVYDYRLANGHRLIEIFDLEHGVDLTRPARRMLRGWSQSYLTLFELVERKGDICRLMDLLTGEPYDVNADSVDPNVERWALIIARPLPLGNEWELSPAQTVLPPVAKESYLGLVRGEYRRHRRAHGDVPVQRFLREQGFLFNDLLVEVDLDETAALLEGDETHRLVHCRALFSVRDSVKVVQRLTAYADIEHFRQGRLVWYESDEAHGPEEPLGRVLAEIQLTGGRLQLHCWSRERLEWAKQLLVERLRGLVLHLVDAYEELQSRGNGNGTGLCTLKEGELAAVTQVHRSQERPDEPVGGAAEGRAVVTSTKTLELETGAWAKAAYEDYVERWLSKESRILDFRSPEFLNAKTLGRIRLAELLKKLEHHQRSRLARGRGLSTVDELRRRLGIDESISFICSLDQMPTVWNSPNEERAARLVAKLFSEKGLSREHIDGVTWMWWDYCYRAYPIVRKPEAWAAALHYAIGIVENWGLTQEDVAELYGVTPSTISTNARRVMELLDLEPFDDRYCVEHPVDGLLERLGRIHHDLHHDMDDPTTMGLAVASRVREELHNASSGSDGLHERAQEIFFGHVGCSERDVTCRESFLDWFHFDWRVPVMGGRTILQSVLERGIIEGETAGVLQGWVDTHPSFYVVEGIIEGGALGAYPAERGPRLTLRELTTGALNVVDWIRIGGPISPKDTLFTRLVPMDELTISLGPVITIPAGWRMALQKAIEEDRALVNRWNDRYIEWDEYRERYAERLYATAFRLARDAEGQHPSE